MPVSVDDFRAVLGRWAELDGTSAMRYVEERLEGARKVRLERHGGDVELLALAQVGRLAHDGGGATLAPRWERYNETPYRRVEKGSVFTLEPSIVLKDHGVVALEEMVLVTVSFALLSGWE